MTDNGTTVHCGQGHEFNTTAPAGASVKCWTCWDQGVTNLVIVPGEAQ